MTLTGFIVSVIGACVVGYAIGSLIEHHKSQEEIDFLVKVIKRRIEEDKK